MRATGISAVKVEAYYKIVVREKAGGRVVLDYWWGIWMDENGNWGIHNKDNDGMESIDPDGYKNIVGTREENGEVRKPTIKPWPWGRGSPPPKSGSR